MCCGQQGLLKGTLTTDRSAAAEVEELRDRLAEAEDRVARARAEVAELTHQLQQMRRFVSVMEILKDYLKRRYLLLHSPPPNR